MAEEIDIPLPVLFNPLKHHRNYILRLLETTSAEMIIDLLDPVCNNYIDLYTGSLTSMEIGQQVIALLKSMKVLNQEAFTQWVKLNNGYRLLTLTDQSQWIVRKSEKDERFVHLHPARSGPFSVRFKGSTLKTIYLLKIKTQKNSETPSLELVNLVRLQVGLSPIHKLDHNKGILSCFGRFFFQV